MAFHKYPEWCTTPIGVVSEKSPGSKVTCAITSPHLSFASFTTIQCIWVTRASTGKFLISTHTYIHNIINNETHPLHKLYRTLTAHTHYTRSLHTLTAHTHYTLTAYTHCTHPYTHTAHSLHTHSLHTLTAHTLHTLTTHSLHTLTTHSLHILTTHSLHTLTTHT
jgi:hypothetical protein